MSTDTLGEILSVRELEVTRWIADGKTDSEIGQILGLTAHTIKNYVSRAREKCGYENRVMLAVRYVREEMSGQLGQQ